MSRQRAVMRAAVLCLALLALPARAEERYRLLFTGDILLAREVAHEIALRHGLSPWRNLAQTFAGADFVMGNLEGTVGDPQDCIARGPLCFAVDPKLLGLLAEAHFAAVGVANNHSGDLGAKGRAMTPQALDDAGVKAIGADRSPAFLRLGERTVAIVALDLVPAQDGVVDAVPSWQAAQKLRLARALADWVVVFVHWGKELADWVTPEQEAQAKWLLAEGGDAIIGAHPHVIQPPQCLDGKPVFYSLGNHVFDQKYAATKTGLIAECRVAEGRLSCTGLLTETPMGSSYPEPSSRTPEFNAAIGACAVPAHEHVAVAGASLRPWSEDRQLSLGPVVLEGVSDAGRWRSQRRDLISLAAGPLASDKPDLLFTLERYPSPIDAEDGPRPYVYEVTPKGLVARWRGSALAWPLLDAKLIADGDRAYLCALHRGDSFIMLDPKEPGPTRTLAYAWNGFGFSGLARADLARRCAEEYAGE